MANYGRSGNLTRQFTDSEREVDGRAAATLAQAPVSGTIGATVGQTYDWMKRDLQLRSMLTNQLGNEQEQAYNQSARAELDRQATQQLKDDEEAKDAMAQFQDHIKNGMDYDQAYQENQKLNPNLPFNDRYQNLMKGGKEYFKTDSSRELQKLRDVNEKLKLNGQNSDMETELDILKNDPDLARQHSEAIKNSIKSKFIQSDTGYQSALFANKSLGTAQEIAKTAQGTQLKATQEAADTFDEYKSFRAKEHQFASNKLDDSINNFPKEAELRDATRGVALMQAQDAIKRFPEDAHIKDLHNQISGLEGDEKISTFEKAKKLRDLSRDVETASMQHQYDELESVKKLDHLNRINGIRTAEEQSKKLQLAGLAMTEDQKAEIVGQMHANGLEGVEDPEGFLKAYPAETSANIRSMISNPDWIRRLSPEDKADVVKSMNALNEGPEVPGFKAAKAFFGKQAGAYMARNREAIDYNDRQKSMLDMSKTMDIGLKDAIGSIDKIVKENSGTGASTKDTTDQMVAHASAFMRKLMGTNELNTLAAQEYITYLDGLDTSVGPAAQSASVLDLMTKFTSKIRDNNIAIFDNKGKVPDNKLKEASKWTADAAEQLKQTRLKGHPEEAKLAEEEARKAAAEAKKAPLVDPDIGKVEGGYRYKGGPGGKSNKDNWEEVK